MPVFFFPRRLQKMNSNVQPQLAQPQVVQPPVMNRGLLLASAKKRRDLIRNERQRLAVFRDHVKVRAGL